MRNYTLMLLPCLALFVSCYSQTAEYNKAVSLENNDTLSELPPDSGRYEGSLKVGRWTEYGYDTLQASTMLVIIGDKQKEVESPESVSITKAVGEYKSGLRSGKWLFFSQSGNPELDYEWELIRETHFKAGKKNGLDILYSFGVDTVTVATYVDDQEHGIGKLFHPNKRNALWKVYQAKNGESLLLKEYYPSGKLMHDISEVKSSTQGKKFKFKTYYENGQLSMVGFMSPEQVREGTWTLYNEDGSLYAVVEYSNGLENGISKYYHDNGQLWTERQYVNGRLWEVTKNFDRQGRRKDKGTITKGTGELKLYDANGNLKEVVEYVEGYEKKQNQ